MDKLSLIELFCIVDDFCKSFHSYFKQQRYLENEESPRKRWWKTREPSLTMSEIMTIAIAFHSSGYRTFKHYYIYLVQMRLQPFFPSLVSYKQFNKLLQRIVFPLFVLQEGLQGSNEGIAFIDSTILTVCHICRASSHKTFQNIAKKGKTTTGWFYGFKLHLVINHAGEIISWMVTAGNVDDRKPAPYVLKDIYGKVFGDRGYISKNLFSILYKQGTQRITRLKKNMKNTLMNTVDKAILYKRSIIESVINKLKHVYQIEHHRHRSKANFVVNLLSGLTAYCLDKNKPSLGCTNNPINNVIG